MKVLILDNYDSFTFNLYQIVGEILEEREKPFQLDVIRNDEKPFEWIKSANYDKIIISPGPGHPADPAYFGVSADILKELGKTTPVLGICLGMQGMATVFGGEVVRANIAMHGKLSPIEHDGKGVFSGLTQGIEIMRYHSLVAKEISLPNDLEITARVSAGEGKGEIMGLRHKSLKIEGVQFHPESFGSEEGKDLLRNFINS
ncbi:anthranilate synthase component 2 [Leptospira meyeri]|uniref:Anthranilate synthase component 2 n=1 Tax=Leptospira meyeri TaxID=29508 RepID=A0A4R8MUY3_LEPME|nr:aminodeoxychorismate/anthranilate synthase component II [Leptospira meyeri]EKJ86803.1 anthranilate synthase component II [Leptospira meyeri serovar Hardjo str. Went 5]TDY73194.1 anthranilate synthase component 2 [Leptospira meyeri]